MENQVETRWLVLGCDGRHVTLGRHRDPDEEDINRAEQALKVQGLGGWLVLLKGEYYVRRVPQLMMVRPLADPAGSWEEATAAFEALRKAAVQPSRVAATARRA